MCFARFEGTWVDDIVRRKTWESSCAVASRKAGLDIIAILYVVAGGLASCGVRVGGQWAFIFFFFVQSR